MLTIKKILCPVDFSEPSLFGLDQAIELARQFQSELEILYVLPVLPPQPMDPNYEFSVPEFEGILHKEAEEKLGALLKEKIPAGIRAKATLGHGHAAKEIVRVAGESKADLVVIATHGHSGWHHLLLGSVAEKVIRHAPCPVFIVRETPKP
jgi:universal stress protein A